MDEPAAKVVQFNRWLPYWAVFQTDVRQTLRSWVFRLWVLVSVLAAVGHLLYHLGIHHQAGMIQHASTWLSGLLRWAVMGSITLVIAMTAGCISSERGTLADSVLSRGISRYQYFLGKWHARLAAVLGTFLVLGLLAMVGSFFFLHEDLSIPGGLVALLCVTVVLAVIITCGVTVSAMVNSTVMGVSVLWLLLCGVAFVSSILPASYPSPERALTNLPFVLRGYYDFHEAVRLTGWSLISCLVVAGVGVLYFSRRDV